eukprot:scaffold17207_cov36-Tisochrysis_lutea.AAC.4
MRRVHLALGDCPSICYVHLRKLWRLKSGSVLGNRTALVAFRHGGATEYSCGTPVTVRGPQLGDVAQRCGASSPHRARTNDDTSAPPRYVDSYAYNNFASQPVECLTFARQGADPAT